MLRRVAGVLGSPRGRITPSYKSRSGPGLVSRFAFSGLTYKSSFVTACFPKVFLASSSRRHFDLVATVVSEMAKTSSPQAEGKACAKKVLEKQPARR